MRSVPRRAPCFTLPVVEASLEEIRELGIELVAAAVDAPTRYTDADLTAPLALVIGAEHAGLGAAWLEAASRIVSIPVAAGSADSLNAATAAAIILFETVRQRG